MLFTISLAKSPRVVSLPENKKPINTPISIKGSEMVRWLIIGQVIHSPTSNPNKKPITEFFISMQMKAMKKNAMHSVPALFLTNVHISCHHEEL